MLSDENFASEVVPAWYTKRMMGDQWYFGLQTIDGYVIAVQRIKAISDDGMWMDVELLMDDETPKLLDRKLITAVADDRRIASIKISSIVAAYDIVTS